MIQFDVLRWKNLLSTGAAFTEVNLSDSSNTLILGENGSGKSTFLDALCFSLFGKSFRKINKVNLVNSVNEKNCVVEIEFRIGKKNYKVIRGIKPNIFEIWCDGVFINQDSASKDYQEYLEKFILKMNYKAFTQIVVLGSAAFTPFMKLTPSDRRAVIEDILDIEVFSVMHSIAKTKFQENRDLIERNRIESIGKDDKKAYIEKSIESLKKNTADRIDSMRQQIKAHEDQCNLLRTEIAAHQQAKKRIEQQTSDLSSLRSKHSKILIYTSKMDTNHRRYRNEVAFFDENDSCPTCKQTINEEFKVAETQRLATKLTELDTGLGTIKEELNSCLADITAREKLNTESANIQNKIQAATSEIQVLTKEAASKNVAILEIEKKDTLMGTNQKELNALVQSIQKLADEKKCFLEEKLLIDTALNLLKDGGIKTKIIKQYLPVINQQINKYLLQMGFFVNFNIDENFDETIKSRYRDTFSYENFSQGEKQRIDLALLFTWRHIAKMRNSVNTNLLIFDEILDGALDTNGTDEFLKIMWNLANDTNTFVISHKTDSLGDKFKKVLTFSKKQNFSVVAIK